MAENEAGRELSSERAIERLMLDYAVAQDAGDFDRVGELFAHGVFRRGDGTEMRGREIADHRKRANILHDGRTGTKHLTTNVVIDVDEEAGTATAQCYYTVVLGTSEIPPHIVAAGRYDDRYERVDGEWRFAYRDSHLDLVGEGFDQHRR